MVEKLDKLSVGAAVEVEGYLVKPPESSKETVEMQLTSILNYGEIRDRETYILNKGRVRPEVIRQYGHLRPKTNLFPQFSEFVMPHHMRYIVSFRNPDFTILTLIFSQLVIAKVREKYLKLYHLVIKKKCKKHLLKVNN